MARPSGGWTRAGTRCATASAAGPRCCGSSTTWRLAQFHDTFWATYQPVSRFWLFQSGASAELLLALILGALAIWLVQRRIA